MRCRRAGIYSKFIRTWHRNSRDAPTTSCHSRSRTGRDGQDDVARVRDSHLCRVSGVRVLFCPGGRREEYGCGFL